MIEGADPRATIAAAMAAFQPLPRAERYGRVSLWTMYYLGALIVPAIADGVRTGRVPTTAIDDLTCNCDAAGHVTGFQPRCAAARVGSDFEEMVEDHLETLIAICDRRAGFPPRVAWSNAAVVIEYAVGEAGRAGVRCAETFAAAGALIEGARYPRLARPFRAGARRVCCLRYLSADGTLCPGICPRAARRTRP